MSQIDRLFVFERRCVKSNMSFNESRHGFTVTEVVVCVAIAAALAMLSLLGIQGFRESSRRMQCANNLREVTLACLQFELAKRELQPTHARNRVNTGLSGASTFYMLGGYLGLPSLPDLMEGIGLSNPVRLESLPHDSRRRLGVFLCPSDSVDNGVNYRLNTGSNAYVSRDWQEEESNGPFSITSTKLSSINDGLSVTAALSERLKSSGIFNHSADIWTPNILSLYSSETLTTDLFVSIIRESGLSPPTNYCDVVGATWHGGGKAFTSYDHVMGPNAPYLALTVGFGNHVAWAVKGVVPATSNHRAGVNVSFLDGSVKLVTDSVDEAIYHAMGSAISH